MKGFFSPPRLSRRLPRSACPTLDRARRRLCAQPAPDLHTFRIRCRRIYEQQVLRIDPENSWYPALQSRFLAQQFRSTREDGIRCKESCRLWLHTGTRSFTSVDLPAPDGRERNGVSASRAETDLIQGRERRIYAEN